ncbi:hypothetical protein FPCIR_6160 [Fusarium pseudocircinatum]|uniref:Uncharacterized protein n=1 Tax=Fusarium pseudocircinatum TaxID=56676 RepID=A0A8H5P758_9HYPO|nr:hypothetical protein FPCIR_6160 [Fusarium pseudocircinatum]
MAEQVPTEPNGAVQPTIPAQTTIPTRGPKPKPTFPVADPPTEWSTYHIDKKIQWLDTHGLKSDNTVNLGDCYRCGVKLRQTFSVVVKPIFDIRMQIMAHFPHSQAQEDVEVFITALNDGVNDLSYMIYRNVYDLLQNGQFQDEAQAITPVPVPELLTISDDGLPQPIDFDKLLDTEPFCVLVEILDLLVEKWPWLSDPRPGKQFSWEQLIQEVIITGQGFFTEYGDLESGNETGDDEVLSHAMSAGLHLGLGRGDDNENKMR